MPPVSLTALRFCSIRASTFGLYHFSQDLAGVNFPNLIDLTLSRITNYENTLHAMVGACFLQSLNMERNYYFRCVRQLVNPYNYVIDELIIVNSPSLEKLILENQGKWYKNHTSNDCSKT
jgi:hypothetical protein